MPNTYHRKTQYQQKYPPPKVPFQTWLKAFTEKHGVGFEAGDYIRIARFTSKRDGRPFTADYIRKVMLGLRDNPMIYQMAQTYFKKKARMYKELKQYAARQ